VESPLHNAGGWFARRARIAGDRLAVVDADRSLAYLALEERTGRCAAALESELRGPATAALLAGRSDRSSLRTAAAPPARHLG
jgi:non-ribosomal peptide synthetase component E (peptide arylation enzyme)